MSRIRPITNSEKIFFDKLASHPLQSWAWGEFREKLGQKVIRLGEFDGKKMIAVCQLFIHPLPHIPYLPQIPYSLAYCPRSTALSPEMLAEIKKIAQKNKCIFVKFEPNVIASKDQTLLKQEDAKLANFTVKLAADRGHPKFARGDAERKNSTASNFTKIPELEPAKSLFTPYTFQLDLTQTEAELLKNLHPKTRYNINLARKKGVFIEEDNSDTAFENFQKLTEETTTRQKFFAHSPHYRELMWQTMRKVYPERSRGARLLVAKYRGIFLSSWILFFWNGVGYYPYGASSGQYRNLMASNLLAWEALLLAKKNNCKKFDFWGALGAEPDKNDPWYGFHRFKEGYGGKLIQLIGTYDLVINPFLYRLYNLADRFRWFWLRHS